MREAGSFQFAFLVPGTPAFLSSWRMTAEASVWDRHYIVGEGYSLKICRGIRLEVSRRSTREGFRVEDELINSTFPLDWMVSMALRRVLPKPIRAASLDARGSAQALVNAMDVDWLPQASVHKYCRTFEKGPMSATVTHLNVPDWAASGILVNLRAREARLLPPLLAEYRLRQDEDLCLDDWLATAWRQATLGTPSARAA